jgi:hypothetical protein
MVTVLPAVALTPLVGCYAIYYAYWTGHWLVFLW